MKILSSMALPYNRYKIDTLKLTTKYLAMIKVTFLLFVLSAEFPTKAKVTKVSVSCQLLVVKSL